jgi:uncharacterized membrane protein YgdD (TMEM256/DUF423 family)
MKPSRFALAIFLLGGVSSVISVAASAFAAHGASQAAIEGVSAASRIAQAADFQMFHGLGMMLVAFISEFAERGTPRNWMRSAAVFLGAAIVLFPGSLYWASFGGSSVLAPVGGVSAMIGWFAFSAGVFISLVRKRTYL